MLRWSRFVLVLGMLMSVGCGGQSPPEPEPQTANRQKKTVEKENRADRTKNLRKPESPSLSKVSILVQPVLRSHRNIISVEILGDPVKKNTENGYQIKNLQLVEGTLPPPGTYFLRNNVTRFVAGKTVEEEAETDPNTGPFFNKKLPTGTRLSEVKFLGKCKADVEGWTGEEKNSTGFKNVLFNVYEAIYEKR